MSFEQLGFTGGTQPAPTQEQQTPGGPPPITWAPGDATNVQQQQQHQQYPQQPQYQQAPPPTQPQYQQQFQPPQFPQQQPQQPQFPQQQPQQPQFPVSGGHPQFQTQQPQQPQFPQVQPDFARQTPTGGGQSDPFAAIGGQQQQQPQQNQQPSPQDFITQLTAYMKGETPTDPQGAQQPFAIPLPEVDERTMTANAPVAPFVQYQVAQMMNEHLAPYLANIGQQTEAARKAAEASQRSLGDTTQQMYANSVYTSVPDFDSLTSHQSFEAYKNQVEPLSGLRVADMLSRANKSRDASTVARIMGGFRNVVTNQQVMPQPQQQFGHNGFNQQVQAQSQPYAAPSASLYPQHNGNPQGQPQLDWNEYSNIVRAFTSGQIDAATFKVKSAPYEQAQSQQDQQAMLANPSGFM